MKVILTTHIKGVGQKGDIKDVSDGYFQNFLAPRKWAVPASSGQLNLVNAQKAKAAEKIENMKEKALAIKEKIHGQTLNVHEKTSESGKLYAALHTKDIANTIKNSFQVEVSEKQIHAEAIKNTGSYRIELDLYKEIKATLTLNVLAA